MAALLLRNLHRLGCPLQLCSLAELPSQHWELEHHWGHPQPLPAPINGRGVTAGGHEAGRKHIHTHPQLWHGDRGLSMASTPAPHPGAASTPRGSTAPSGKRQRFWSPHGIEAKSEVWPDQLEPSDRSVGGGAGRWQLPHHGSRQVLSLQVPVGQVQSSSRVCHPQAPAQEMEGKVHPHPRLPSAQRGERGSWLQLTAVALRDGARWAPRPGTGSLPRGCHPGSSQTSSAKVGVGSGCIQDQVSSQPGGASMCPTPKTPRAVLTAALTPQAGAAGKGRSDPLLSLSGRKSTPHRLHPPQTPSPPCLEQPSTGSAP